MDMTNRVILAIALALLALAAMDLFQAAVP